MVECKEDKLSAPIQGSLKEAGHWSCLQQIKVSTRGQTWGPQIANRIDLAQKICIRDVIALFLTYIVTVTS